jgi:hypothetical protein
MNPENVSPRNFVVKSILLTTPAFSVAYGCWEGEYDTLAMRWNGDTNEDAGYPKAFGYPMWFIIPAFLTIPISKALLDTPGSRANELLTLLEQEYRSRNTKRSKT